MRKKRKRVSSKLNFYRSKSKKSRSTSSIQTSRLTTARTHTDTTTRYHQNPLKTPYRSNWFWYSRRLLLLTNKDLQSYYSRQWFPFSSSSSFSTPLVFSATCQTLARPTSSCASCTLAKTPTTPTWCTFGPPRTPTAPFQVPVFKVLAAGATKRVIGRFTSRRRPPANQRVVVETATKTCGGPPTSTRPGRLVSQTTTSTFLPLALTAIRTLTFAKSGIW